MGLILRVPHYPLPTGATVSNSRLSLEQMDQNFIFLQNISSGGGIITLSYNEAVNTMQEGNVVAGSYYLITNVNKELYGTYSPFGFGEGTDIILTGLDSNNFTKNGWGKFYNPNYYQMSFTQSGGTGLTSGYFVYDSSVTYSTGNIAIYGGQVWQSKTSSNINNSSNPFSLDTDYWNKLPYNNTNYYNVVWDDIEFDFGINSVWTNELSSDPSGWITSRYDGVCNNLVKMTGYTNWFFCEISNIQAFRWGHLAEYGGVVDCEILDSYAGLLNYVSGSTEYGGVSGLKMTNYSYIYDLQILNGGFLNKITLENGAGLSNITINNSGIYNLTATNDSLLSSNSGLMSIQLQDSSMHDINLNHSKITDSNFTNAEIYDIYGDNESYLSYLTLNNSYIQNINLTNGSYIQYTEIDGYMYNIKMDNESYIQYVWIDSDSYLTNINLNNNSYIDGGGFNTAIYLWHSGFDYLTLNNNSYIQNGSSATGFGPFNYSFDLYSSFIYNVDINNYSKIEIGDNSTFLMWNGAIGQLRLDNNSKITAGLNSYSNNQFTIIDYAALEYNTLINHSTLDDLIIDGSSVIRNLYLDSSSIYNNNLSGSSNFEYTQLLNSAFYNTSLHSSSINNNELSSSSIYYISLTSSSISGSCFKQSNFSSIYPNGGDFFGLFLNNADLSSYSGYGFTSLYMNSCYLYFSNNSLYNIPNYTEFKTNTLVYKFNITFDGTSGHGATGSLILPGNYLIPSGFYIEKVLVDGVNIVVNSISSTLNIGMSASVSSGLLHSNISSNFVVVSDISNGGASGYKSTGDIIVASVTQNNITGGTIYLEITLKNTNYGYDND